MDRDCGVTTVVQAQAGDQRATDELISSHLPLVYNIVGRALGGHPDTDDVVQDTMLRAVDSLPALREPASFRSWLVAIAMNQVRRRHQEHLTHQAYRAATPGPGFEDAYEPADPGADFVDLTIVRLGLAGQRREVAEATRWLDEADRELLSLWWLEAAGELTRAELAGALELSPQHAAVRVQRMKGQLETARVVVRALATTPPCSELAELTAGWDGVPSALWRKRIARHARDCGVCSRHWSGLVPAEGLLAGLALVPVPHTYGASAAASLLGSHSAASASNSAAAHSAASNASVSNSAVSAGHRARPNGGGRRHRAKPRRRMLTAAVGTAVLTLAAVGVVAADQDQPADSTARTDAAAAASQPVPVEAALEKTASASPTPTLSPTPTPTPTPSKSPSASPTPTPSVSRSATPSTTAQQVLDLVNTERARAGCAAVRSNSKLQAAAQGHSDDMAARNFFDHTNPDGEGPQPRIEAQGYRWSTWGENIARGQRDATAVMTSWMNSPGHKANILNCAFTELGVGVHQGTGGPWWTQDFGTPR
ncbi:hypothetical protein GCM10010193_41000 [Kitasatospora atroaurantiaca]|uniref:RNA polymerase sigma factor (Sigma-70 family) n=1 Tax=Kitasatospora atroaurantiaca TaxID=285545 RepID=A0A561F1D2_9ACTN|nr:sigma-70 family RNA polymerase sigma factor [Kitasatospora atroaurantiaca]TWE21673.1 RNA polymerase sigma factor (sigma-70 family) [Kitasatospora atroaurantiaca]